MRKRTDLVATAAALVGATLLAGPARAQGPERTRDEAAAVDSLLAGATIVLQIDGMSCPLCAYGLEQRLEAIAAVDTVVIRVSDGVALIREQEGQTIEDAALHEAVQRAGFTLREVRRVKRRGGKG